MSLEDVTHLTTITRPCRRTVNMSLLNGAECYVSDAWKSRWVESKQKSDYGVWKLTAGKFFGDAEADKGNLHIAFTSVLLLSSTLTPRKKTPLGAAGVKPF